MAVPQAASHASAEQALRDALRDLLGAMEMSAGASGRQSSDLAGAIRRVEQAAMALGNGAPAQLRHFLERRSYTKALAFLEERGPELGQDD